MKELVFLKSNQALTTSLKMAEYFEKRHDNVLQAIERANSTLLNFKGSKNAITKTSYKDLSAAVKELYEWAVSHGCKAPEKVFCCGKVKL